MASSTREQRGGMPRSRRAARRRRQRPLERSRRAPIQAAAARSRVHRIGFCSSAMSALYAGPAPGARQEPTSSLARSDDRPAVAGPTMFTAGPRVLEWLLNR